MATKTEWRAAKAALDEIEKERDALLKPTDERWQAAYEALEEIEENCPERIGLCECGEPIWEGERYSYDSVNGIRLCEPCSPDYAAMLAEPGNFYDENEEYLTPEKAKAIVDAHLAAGGKLTDKMVSA